MDFEQATHNLTICSAWDEIALPTIYIYAVGLALSVVFSAPTWFIEAFAITIIFMSTSFIISSMIQVNIINRMTGGEWDDSNS